VPREEPRRGGSRLSWLGLAVSLLAVAGVVWWAVHQPKPDLPSTRTEILALLGAIALYALATVVRSERWQRLLEDEGGVPARVDTYALTCVGYAGNNILPARAGDAIRAVLMAPRAGTSIRTVIGTLLAERLLDIAVLVVLFVVVGYGLLGEVGGDKVEIILLAAAGLAIAAVIAYFAVRRNERLVAFITPMLSATLGLRRAHHGLLLLGMTLVIWGIEAGVWMSAAACVGFGMDPIEGLYIVALASVFSMIPSGPAYAGTQDAAAILGIKALGGTGAQAVAYIVMLRFIIVVPITLVGLVLLAARYGGLGRLREARR
jgi:glycosyltransferase 2 family protein